MIDEAREDGQMLLSCKCSLLVSLLLHDSSPRACACTVSDSGVGITLFLLHRVGEGMLTDMSLASCLMLELAVIYATAVQTPQSEVENINIWDPPPETKTVTPAGNIWWLQWHCVLMILIVMG